MKFLAKYGIQTRPFYPNLNSARHLGCTGDFPHSKLFGEQGLFLPCGPEQPLKNIDAVINTLCLYRNKIKRSNYG
jgi:dTDP-4-amino-4,6-dideoxygalactose transaminase